MRNTGPNRTPPSQQPTHAEFSRPVPRPRFYRVKIWRQRLVHIIDDWKKHFTDPSPQDIHERTQIDKRHIRHITKPRHARKEMARIRADQQAKDGHKILALWTRFVAMLGIYPDLPGETYLLKKLGEGNFGRVDSAFMDKAGPLQAVKRVKNGRNIFEQLAQFLWLKKERDLLNKMDHPNIIKPGQAGLGYRVEGSIKTSEALFMQDGGAPLSQLIYGQTLPETGQGVQIHGINDPSEEVVTLRNPDGGIILEKQLAVGGPLPSDLVHTIASQMLDALQYLKQQHIIHKDIKPANILIDQSKTVRLADFGVSEEVDASHQFQSEDWAGTPGYLAPEVGTLWEKDLLHQNHNPPAFGPEADVYSAGCVLFELMVGKKYHDPGPSPQNPEAYNQLILSLIEQSRNPAMLDIIRPALEAALPNATDAYINNATDLLKKMLAPDPNARITPEQAKAHPFFTQAAT